MLSAAARLGVHPDQEPGQPVTHEMIVEVAALEWLHREREAERMRAILSGRG